MSSEITANWNEHFNGEISEVSIRENFPPGKYRVSAFSYPAGTKFPGSMIGGKCFVLQGQCAYCFNDVVVELKANEFTSLPQGSYILEVRGEEELKIVLVWDLSSMK